MAIMRCGVIFLTIQEARDTGTFWKIGKYSFFGRFFWLL
jgi:hypothetical protein